MFVVLHVAAIVFTTDPVRAETPFADVPNAAGLRQIDRFTVGGDKHLIRDYSPRTKNGLVQAVVEIPAGTNEKWEVDKTDGKLKWEIKDGKPRIVAYLPYPMNYGMVPRTVLAKDSGGDGDPLDVLVLGPAVPRGSVLEVKVVGVLKLLDRGEQDDKLLAVVAGSPLENVSGLAELKEKYPGVLEIIQNWFSYYKPNVMTFQRFGDEKEASQVLDQAIGMFAK
jgi:inorganic pyrophosphatase